MTNDEVSEMSNSFSLINVVSVEIHRRYMLRGDEVGCCVHITKGCCQ